MFFGQGSYISSFEMAAQNDLEIFMVCAGAGILR
jgi:hypothetical protein